MKILDDPLCARYTACPEIRISAHDAGIVLLDTQKGLLYTANAIGGRIWKEAMCGLSGRAIAQRIGWDYGMPCAEVERDTSAFLAELCRHDLIRPVPGV
jgi:Coenzyme PQQ synthesis protein D (PqqD)